MEQLKSMKELLTSQVHAQLANIEKADAQELGAAVDMIKDIAMTMYYCSVVEAMEKADEEAKKNGGNGETVYYTERYLPMYMPRYAERRMYDDTRYNEGRMYRDGDNDGRYNESNKYAQGGNNGRNQNSGNRNYHDLPYDYDEPIMRDMAARRTMIRDMREGRSPQTRRMYMEAKEQHQGKEIQLQELEKYMGELSQDVTEMIADATPEERQMLHKKMVALTNKIEVLANKG